MKLLALAIAPALILLAACGGNSDPTAVETVTVEAQTPAIDWDYIRTQYAKTLSQTECVAGGGLTTGVCNQMRNADLRYLRIDVEKLPPSRDRTKMIASLDDWNEKYSEYDVKMCLGSRNTGQFDCSFDETLLNMNMITIEAIAKNATG